MRIDARIPLVIGPVPPGPADHVVTEGTDFDCPASATHDPACACCVGRSPVAGLLGGLFFARARGEVPFFRRLVVSCASAAGRAAVVAALSDDPVVSGCYRPG